MSIIAANSAHTITNAPMICQVSFFTSAASASTSSWTAFWRPRGGHVHHPATAEIIAWPERCEQRKASRAKPNNRRSHRHCKSNRATKHDHDIEKQTLSWHTFTPSADEVFVTPEEPTA
jgi:hypothetical protein